MVLIICVYRIDLLPTLVESIKKIISDVSRIVFISEIALQNSDTSQK